MALIKALATREMSQKKVSCEAVKTKCMHH